VITVGTQSGIKTVEYVNEAGKVRVNAEASGIKYKASSACGISLEGANAKYREGEFVAGVAKLAPEGHPAVALSEGFNELAEPDSVEVQTTHWYKNGAILKEGTKLPIVTWGALALNSAAGSATCHAAGGGYLENPVGGGSGISHLELLGTFECESKKVCPTGQTPEVTAEKLPWAAVVEEPEALVRMRISGVKVFVACVLGGKVESGTKFVTNEASACCKALMPVTGHGTSTTHPGFFEFGAGSGELEKEGSAEATKDTVESELKYVGFGEQDLINTKSP
jgi:hypothetical protein